MQYQSPAWFDAMYNNRAMVPDFPVYFDQWLAQSQKARQELHSLLDVSYGSGPQETLDIFPSKIPNAPVVVFIHGGYWRSLDKSDHSFIAPSFVEAGACVVVPNYALCPDVTIPQIVMQMVKALIWVYRYIHHWGGDPSRIHVQGHSAGGHLAAMLMACQWRLCDDQLPDDLVKTALSVSGLHELHSVMQAPFLHSTLKLTNEHVLKASPAWMPAPAHGKLIAVAGGLESDEFKRHCILIQQAWGKERVPQTQILDGIHHFNIVQAYADVRHPLHQLALGLLAR